MDAKSISEYVKQRRKEHNLTQIELSEKSGVGLRLYVNLNKVKKLFGLIK